MPMPTNLPIPDWSAISDSGLDFESWLEKGEYEKNIAKLRELYERQQFPEEVGSQLSGLARPIHVVAIAEDWCPDVIRHVAVLQKMADRSDALSVHYVTRKSHPEIFIRYLTNGGEAIPKFIFLNDQYMECGNWGPMPECCKESISRGKACGDVKTARVKVAECYKKDKERTKVITELMRLVDIASAETP
jgi:hypothetical protein